MLSLLKNRYDWNRKTIVTTNLALRLDTLPDAKKAESLGRVIERRYGDPLMSRLSNSTAAAYVVCRGDDLRAILVPGCSK
jgi:hypothetical protein